MQNFAKQEIEFIDKWIALAGGMPEAVPTDLVNNSSQSPIVNVDEAQLIKAGKSKFHMVFGGLLISFTFWCQNFFVYAFGFFTLQPKQIKCIKLGIQDEIIYTNHDYCSLGQEP